MEIVIKFKNWILEFRLIVYFSLTLASIYSVHPLPLCLILILLAVRVGGLSGLVFSKWIFYAVVLIFLGGIIVVFIYVTTLAGNEKFHINFTWNSCTLFLLSSVLVYIYAPKLTQLKKEIFIGHIYFSSTTFVLWFLLIFLLSTLIIVIKLAENFKGTLIKFI